MQKVKEIVGRCRTSLLQHKQSRMNAINNPTVVDWLRLNNPDLPTVARQFGVTADLEAPRKKFNELAGAIQRRLDVLDNDLGSLTADLSLKSTDPGKMLGIAEQIEKRCVDLTSQVDLLLSIEKTFCDADTTLRQNLKLGNLINAVPAMTGGSANFDLGLKVLQCSAGEESIKGDQPVLRDFLLKANNLVAKLQRVEFPDQLPPAAQAVILEQITRVIEAIRLIGNYVDYVDSKLADLTPAVQQLEQSLKALKKEQIAVVFSALPELSQQCGTIVTAFQKYAKILTAVERLEILLEEIKLFSISIKGDFLEDLFRETSTNGPLHPSSIAKRYTRQYFAGISGLFRICRFLFAALLGQRMLTEHLLENLLESALAQVPRNASDPKLKKAIIEEISQKLLADFAKPFPYEELSQLTRKILTDYFSAIEATFKKREISFPNETGELTFTADDLGKQQNTTPLTFAKLVSRIEVRAENLQECI